MRKGPAVGNDSLLAQFGMEAVVEFQELRGPLVRHLDDAGVLSGRFLRRNRPRDLRHTIPVHDHLFGVRFGMHTPKHVPLAPTGVHDEGDVVGASLGAP